MYPWVAAGIVRFVRTPADYDSRVYFQTIADVEKRRQANPELDALLKKEVDDYYTDHATEILEWAFLQQPDESMFRELIEFDPENAKFSYEQFKAHIAHRRASHPYYLDQAQSDLENGNFITTSSGANYDLAKITANLSGSHLITDIQYRWREIEIDREKSNIDKEGWSPFAKALGRAELSYLDNVPLKAALELREKGRLERMRLFFRKVWKSAASNQPFDSVNAANLAAELDERVREAQGEYDKIQFDLTTWIGSTGAAAISSSWLAAGNLAAVAAATATVSGAINLANASYKRAVLDTRLPAAFFARLRRK